MKSKVCHYFTYKIKLSLKSRISTISVVYIIYKFNIITCMKVTGETFSFHHKRKRAEGARCHKHRNFQAKGLLPDRTLESFIPKSTEGAIPIFRNNLTEFTKKLFLNLLGRIFQVKRQSIRII